MERTWDWRCPSIATQNCRKGPPCDASRQNSQSVCEPLQYVFTKCISNDRSPIYCLVTSDMKLAPNVGSDRSWVYNVAADVSDGEPQAETLAIRFANSESKFYMRANVTHYSLSTC